MFDLEPTPRSPANGGMLSGHWLRHMSPGPGRQAIYNRILADQVWKEFNQFNHLCQTRFFL